MAKTTQHIIEDWSTIHENGSYDLKKLLTTRNEGKTNMPSPFDRYNDTANEMRQLIREP